MERGERGGRRTQTEAIRGRVLESRKRDTRSRKRHTGGWQRHKAKELKTGRQGRGGRVFLDEGERVKKQGGEVWELPGINLQCSSTLSLLLAQCRWRIFSAKWNKSSFNCWPTLTPTNTHFGEVLAWYPSLLDNKRFVATISCTIRHLLCFKKKLGCCEDFSWPLKMYTKRQEPAFIR